jgi:double-stranded uracil-DNA glycosylase
VTRPEGNVRPETGDGRSTESEHSADEGSIPSSSTNEPSSTSAVEVDGSQPASLPLALAAVHRDGPAGAGVALRISAVDRRWGPADVARVVTGAGFAVVRAARRADGLHVAATRVRTLPDYVGAGMRVLVCGLNPSLVAADAGFGYAGPTNRFWPAAVAAGLVTRPRDPLHALVRDQVGMTDMVKRATPSASALTAQEYRAGAERVAWVVAWLRPSLVLFVGLAGWRAAVDRRAVAGVQPEPFAGAVAYVMPSTSGLNAHARLADLSTHMVRARAAAGPPTS